jgi:hypothetical protein
MSTRRLAPLSLALVLALGAGVASAAPIAPAEKGESAFKSLKMSFKAGVQQFKERRAAAGPGLIKRTLLKTGAMLKSAKNATMMGLKSARNATVETAHEIKMEVVEANRQIAADARAVGSAVKGGTMATIGVVRAAPGVVASKVASARQARRDYKEADRDFKAWLKEPGNENIATFYKGAKAESGVNALKALRGVGLVTTGAYAVAGIANGDPIAAGIGGGGFGASLSMGKDIKAASRDARERAVNMGMGKVSAERLEKWSKAGIIDPSLAK